MKVIIACILMLLVVGCREPEVTGPPELRLGKDMCVHCGMLINDARYAAAALVRENGRAKAVLFDDIGDLVDYIAANPAAKFEGKWVSDSVSRNWIDATTAQYVHVPGLHTPMGSGLVAYAPGASIPADQGPALTYADLPSKRESPHGSMHQ